MDIPAFSLLLAIFFTHPVARQAQSTPPISSHITVVGAVYCDTCLDNGFSSYSYFMPGADVHIRCKFNANSPTTAEMMTFSVNRTTDNYGVYKFEVPSVDGVDCIDGPPIQSFCQATLLGSSSSTCSVPTLKATTTAISVKSKQENLCVYSFTPLSFRPSEKNHSLCGKQAKELPDSATSSKFLLPHNFPLPTQPTSTTSRSSNLPSLPFPSSPHDPRTWTPLIPPLAPPNPQKQYP